ncbi:MAG: ABC transporter permease [Armatimonadota bacterium]
MNALRVWGALVRISIRGQMAYRASFLMLAAGQLGAIGLEFCGLAALAHRYGDLPGWPLPTIALLYGMAQIAFALAEATFRGFDQFAGLVRGGDFDRFLIRPWPASLLVAGQTFELRCIGRATAGLAALAWGAPGSGIAWDVPAVGIVASAIATGAMLFGAVLVLQATLCFWTVESVEIANAITYGGVTAASLPLSLYPNWLRIAFTWVVPLVLVNTVPIDVLLGRGGIPGWLPWCSPLVGGGILALALAAFEGGVRKYASAGG